MKRAPFLFSLILAVATSRTAFAATERVWTIDPVHSSAEFTVKHLGFFHVKGTIPIKDAQIVSGQNSAIPLNVSATLDPSGIDTKNGDRDDDLRSPHFFDVKHYPNLTFKSTNVIAGEKGYFSIVGDLTLHGMTKTITLNAHFEGQGRDGRGRQRVGYTASAQIDRRDFGMNYGEATPGGALIVGNVIQIGLAVEAVEK